jgi:LmbE family N-acetylglucosaminyl deacetylase
VSPHFQSRRFARTFLALALAALGPLASAQLAPLPEDTGANGLALALRRLPVVGRVLYVTAHPDDEHNGVQVRLSRGRGLHVGLLTLTRGAGGQNAIGPELGEALAVLRTEELAAVHRYDGAQQLFGRSFDFGFSFSIDETLRRWGREATLGDVVRAFRVFRPDVVLTLPLESNGGGQHHQAAAQMAREAFRAAADPRLFPDQIAAGLRPWQARKLYQGGVGGGLDRLAGSPVVVDTATFDPLLGMSWQQFGSLARSMHRCQGVGQLRADPLTGSGSYWLVDAEPPMTGPDADLLSGVDTSLEGLAADLPRDETSAPIREDLDRLVGEVTASQTAFDARHPEACVAPLAAALRSTQSLRRRLATLAGPGPHEMAFRLEAEERDITRALTLAHAVYFEALSAVGDVVPGQSFAVDATVFNQGELPLAAAEIGLRAPKGWTVDVLDGSAGPVAPRQSRRLRFRVLVAPDARPSRPYFRLPRGADRYEIDSPADEGQPWSPPDLVATLRIETVEGTWASLEDPVSFRYPGRWVGGEKRKVVNVVPALSVRLLPEVMILPLSATRPMELRAAVVGELTGPATVRLEAPPGWRVEPREATLEFARAGQEVETPFHIVPPPAVRAGETRVQAVAVRGGQEFREGFEVVAYDHIQERHVFDEAESRIVEVDATTPKGISVGYVMGTGDDVPAALRQLGVPVTLLEDSDLAAGDLSRFTTIVTGIRAYQARAALRSANPRLLRYVAAGGHLVVQYNREEFNAPGAAPGEYLDSPFAPYPGFRVTTDRTTDEDAPPRIVADDPVLREPNPIDASDWKGWVQERGLQFARVADPRYRNLLAFTDPFPNNSGEKTGALVVAAVGKGTWTYTGLSLFRQLPAGVPGAYRLLANLVGRLRGH